MWNTFTSHLFPQSHVPSSHPHYVEIDNCIYLYRNTYIYSLTEYCYIKPPHPYSTEYNVSSLHDLGFSFVCTVPQQNCFQAFYSSCSERRNFKKMIKCVSFLSYIDIYELKLLWFKFLGKKRYNIKVTLSIIL